MEKGKATHSSILAWRIPWTEEAWWGYSPWGHRELDTNEAAKTFSLSPGQRTHPRLGWQEDRMTAPGWDISKVQSTDVWASGRTGDRGVVLALTERSPRNCIICGARVWNGTDVGATGVTDRVTPGLL